MRAYKFLDAHFGLKSLYEKRLKQSRIHELNDPFELTPYVLTDPNLRQAFLTTRDDISNNRGVLCFSAAWRDPVIWAHYSDKHRGLCLGLEIPEIKGDPGNDESMHVSYIPEPLQFPHNFSDLPEQERLVIVQTILFTKFDNWKYEEEIRMWATLQDEEGGLYFRDFDETIRLVEVIIGAKSTIPKSTIIGALGPLASEVKVTKARAAYDKFEIVGDEQ